MSWFGKLLGLNRDRAADGGDVQREPSAQLSLQRQVIDTNHLRIGMYVVELDRPWSETSFMFQGFTIEAQEDIDELRAACEFVYVERLVEMPGRRPEPHGAVSHAPSDGAEEVSQLRERVAEVSDCMATATSSLASIFHNLHLDGQVDRERLQAVVHDCIESVLHDNNATLLLTQIRDRDGDGARHAMNVAILAITLGRLTGLGREQLDVLGICGLLHDVGKVRVPQEVLAKEGQLSRREVEEIRRHTVHGRDLLLAQGKHYAAAADVAYSHHERVDGRGYPRGLSGCEISLNARVISIAEAYDAITTETGYRAGRSAHEAQSILYRNRGKQFDEELVYKFIDSIGVFPPGSLVEMSNGEVGIILGNNAMDKLKPRVLILLDESKQPCDQRVVDLVAQPIDQSGRQYHIRDTLRNGSHELWVEDFIRSGLRLNQI